MCSPTEKGKCGLHRNRILFNCKKNEIKKSSGKGMDLICIILSKVTQVQKRIGCSSSCAYPSL